MNGIEFETAVVDGGVDHGPGTAVERVSEVDWSDVDGLAGDGFAAQGAVTAAPLEIAAGHHHVPGGEGIEVAHKQKRPEEWHEDRRRENGVFSDQAPLVVLTLRPPVYSFGNYRQFFA